jgi:hypothetical protein
VAYRSGARYGPADHPGRARPGTGWGDHSGHWPRTTSTRPAATAQRAAYQPPPALDPVDEDDEPRRGRSRFAKLVLLLGLLALVGAGTLAAGWRMVRGSYPASVALPAQLAGMTMVDKPKQGDDLENVVAGVATGAGVGEALAGVYTKPDGGVVYVVVASGLFLRPDRVLRTTMTEFAALGFAVAQSSAVDAGPAGGAVRCGTGTLGPPPGAGSSPAPAGSAPAPASGAPTPAPAGAGGAGVLLCGWADHGSVGVIGMPGGADAGAGATLVRAIREAAVTR